MKQRQPTVNIVRYLVSLLSYDCNITSITDNLDGTYTLTTCNTYHLQPSFKVIINSVEYKIISVVRNVNLVVSGASLPGAYSFTIYNPYFFHGTPNQTSNELTHIKVSSNKTPMGYFVRPLTEDYKGRDSAIDRTIPDFRLLFLTQSPTQWTSQEFFDNAIQPMRDLAYMFIDRCQHSPYIGKFDETGFTILEHQRIGIEKAGLFGNECLSGVELKIRDFPILVSSQFCPCTIIVLPSGFTYEDLSALTYEQVMAMTYEELTV